jgi:hypothetical protein
MVDVRLKCGKAYIPGRPPGDPQTNRGRGDEKPALPALRIVVFGPLPKTFTGKIQKFVLRERVKENI